MRPARIQVFDGLRVATEHIDHLQDGLHSSIEDLREAVGLGRIVRGFDVTVDGPGVVVGPGLAFDNARNRLAVDEPQRIDVTFPVGQDAQYLCAKYERVEDHQVEGKATLVWDTTSLVLQPTLPAASENPIPLAKLVRTQDGVSFHVVALDASAGTDAPAATDTPAATDAPPTTATSPTTDTTAATDTTTTTDTTTATEAPATTEPAPEAQPPPLPAPAAAQPAVQLRQGVVALPSGIGADDKGVQALIAALRARLGGQPNGDVRVTLGTGDVAVDFPPAGISCDTSLSADVRPTAKPGWQCTSTARGEATFAGGNVVAQYALSSGLARPLAAAEGVGLEHDAPELTQNRLAQVSLAPGAASDEPAGRGRAAIEHVTVAVRATPSLGGFGVACELVWSGDVSEDQIAALEGEAIALSWSAQIGWKAVGA